MRPLEKVRRWAAVVALLGIVAFALSLSMAPDRAWGSWLAGAWFTLGLGAGGALTVAMLYLTGAGWVVVVRRVPEQMGVLLPLGALLLLIALAGAETLFPWTRPEVLAASPIIADKQAYLNLPFMIVRAVLFFGLWIWLANRLATGSDPLQQGSPVAHTRRMRRIAAILVVVFAPTFILTSVDWLMSLQPAFYSTVFGLYTFCGIMLAATALITIVVILLRRSGLLPEARADHLHDLGRLLIVWSTMWAYMWLSQYLLIWYTNIPEEVTFYLDRHAGVWGSLWTINLLLNWVVPFILLLPRENKRREGILLAVSGVVLVGQMLDVMHLIAPVVQTAPVLGWVELLVPMIGPALFVLLLIGRLRRVPLVPTGDPFLQESITHHV